MTVATSAPADPTLTPPTHNFTLPFSNRVLVILGLLVAFVWFANLDYRKLIKTDEGRYAEIAREMVMDDDWVTPRLNGFKYFYKPPLQYWATAAAYKIFGIDEWTARLWTALTGFAAVLFTGFVAARLWGRTIGITSASILVGTIYWIGMGHFSALDMSLAAFMSSTIFAFILAQSDATTARERHAWMLVAWASAALAVMTKGFVGIVLPAGALVFYLAWERDTRILRRLHWVSGVVVFVLITVPWFVLVSIRNPEFFDFFVIREHFTRFTTKEHGRYEPWWYFVPLLLAGMVPFSLGLIAAARASWTRAAARFQPQRFLLVWTLVVFLFFSASSSKLPSYLLPIVPALAVLIALGLARTPRRGVIAQWALVAMLGVFIASSATQAGAWMRHDDVRALVSDYVPWIIATGVVLAGGALIACVLAWREQIVASTIVMGASSLIATQLAISGHESLAPVYSSYHIAQKIKSEVTADTALFVVNTFDHTLPFYLQRTLTMVAYKDELAAAIAWESQKFIADLPAFERAWRQAPKAVALMEPGIYAQLSSQHLPMTIIARDARRVVVKRP